MFALDYFDVIVPSLCFHWVVVSLFSYTLYIPPTRCVYWQTLTWRNLYIYSLEAAFVAKDMLIRLGLVSESQRWVRESVSEIYPVFKDVEGVDLIVKRSMHFTNKTAFPRTVFADVALRIMGRKINLMKVDLRTEGLQELLQRFSALTPMTSTEMSETITEFLKKVT